jgi:hypothetical protein
MHSLPLSPLSPPYRCRAGLRSRFTASFAFVVSILLAGCATSLPVPAGRALVSMPRWAHVVIQPGGAAPQDAILIVQHDSGHQTSGQQDGGQASRWSLLDPLGAPLARQILDHGHWRNDGFLPPNHAASAMFTNLIFAWTPEADLARRYRGQPWHVVTGPDGRKQRFWGNAAQPRLRICYGPAADAFTLSAGAVTWQVSPLPGAPR